MTNAKFLYELCERDSEWPDRLAFIIETAQVLHPALPPETMLAITPASVIIEAQYRVQDDRLMSYRRSIGGAVFQYFHGTVNALVTFDEFVALREGLDQISRKYNAGGYYVLEGFKTWDDQKRAYGVALAAFLEPYLSIIEKDGWKHAKERQS